MTSPIVAVEGIGKQYIIGAAPEAYRTLRGSIMSWLRVRKTQAEKRVPFWALRDITFKVEPGEVVGVVGRNGAGKSTLLKVISRITPPTEGRIRLVGRVGSLLEVGTGFHPELTGRENAFLSGAILGMSQAEIRRRFDEIVAFAEIEQFLDTPVKHYSSGMYARLAFSVAAHLESEILIVDEVLAVGDSAFQRKCLTRMGEIGLAGRTVFFVSHNLPAVARLCSRALLLEHGHLVRDGRTDDVLESYLNKFANTSALAEWRGDAAASSSGVRLLSVRLSTTDGQLAASARVDQPLQLVVRYHVERPLSFRCAAILSTQGAVAFTSIEPKELMRVEPGDYESTLLLPPDLLTEGEYTVTVSLVASRGVTERLAAAVDAVSFLVSDPMNGSSARGDYAERLSGLVCPRLTWSMLRVSSETALSGT